MERPAVGVFDFAYMHPQAQPMARPETLPTHVLRNGVGILFEFWDDKSTHLTIIKKNATYQVPGSGVLLDPFDLIWISRKRGDDSLIYFSV
jgi:hypothetical protein